MSIEELSQPCREAVTPRDERIAASETQTGDAARTDAVAEWLEQGEYLDPDTLDWPGL